LALFDRYVFAKFQNNLYLENIKDLTASDPGNKEEYSEVEFQKAQTRTIPTYDLAGV
jgi:hypothetical protein